MLLGPVFLLLALWLVKLMTNVPNWSLTDFVIVYVLLAGAGLAYEMKTGEMGNIISWLFGIVVLAIGVINTFWGNDPFFGIFILLLSFVYFPPVNDLFKNWTGFSIHRIVKILLGLFILWAAIGVGELFHKIDLMMKSL